MDKFEAESIVGFWGGIDSCKSLINSFNSKLLSKEKKEIIESNYKIKLMIEAVEFLEKDNGKTNPLPTRNRPIPFTE